jgi:hypothetical protein
MTATFAYIETTIPVGVRVDEYRRSRPRKRSLWQRITRR